MRSIRSVTCALILAACSSGTPAATITTTEATPTTATVPLLVTTTTAAPTTTGAPATTAAPTTTAVPTTVFDPTRYVMHNVEQLAGTTTSPGLFAVVQDMTAWDNGYAWGGLGQLFVGSTLGDWIEFVVPIQVTGTYEIEVWLTRAPDFGIVRVTIDGADVEDIDLYGPEVRATQGLSMGEFSLTAGAHTVRFSVIGRAPQSTDTKIGIDTITLIGPI